MTQKSDTHIFTGLQLDVSLSQLTPEHLIDALNIRITAKQGETLFSLTNERGPLLLLMVDKDGNDYNINSDDTIIGYCNMNDYLILFIEGEEGDDIILRVDMSLENPVAVELFKGDLNFNSVHPIMAMPDYENEDIQKVYWTDNYNQPRLINIMKEDYTWNGSFDFNPTIDFTTITSDMIKVTKKVNGAGTFSPGVILYAFTYYNKHAQETAIFHITPLYYISPATRGGDPEKTVSNSFTIDIPFYDVHFDYIRIYSIQRTSLDGTPICKRVQDIELPDVCTTSLIFTDTGNEGDIIDSTALLFKGGESLLAKDICFKDGTMFLANIKTQKRSISSIEGIEDEVKTSETSTYMVENLGIKLDDYYVCDLLNPSGAFKNREYYRLGFQALYKDGSWSEPMWIKDYLVNSDEFGRQTKGYLLYSLMEKLYIECKLPLTVGAKLREAGYIHVRPLVVFPDISDRTIISQGIINPTLSTNNNVTKGVNALSSWFWRPFLNGVTSQETYRNSSFFNATSASPYSGTNECKLIYTDRGESYNPNLTRAVEIQGQYDDDDKFWINWKILTYHSPELEFDDSLKTFDYSNVKARVVGEAPFYATTCHIDLTTSTPTVSGEGSGMQSLSATYNASNGIISNYLFDDWVVDDVEEDDFQYFRDYNREFSPVKYLIYPWLKNNSLNNDAARPPKDTSPRTAMLSTKILTNLRIASSYFYTSSELESMSQSILGGGYPKVFDSLEIKVIRVNNKIYQGNIDTLLTPSVLDGHYFVFKGLIDCTYADTKYTESSHYYRSHSLRKQEGSEIQVYDNGLYLWQGSSWERKDGGNIGDDYPILTYKKEPVRMKYKTTPHLVMYTSEDFSYSSKSSASSYLPIVEIYRDYNASTMFGGLTKDALKQNTWIPAGNPVYISNINTTSLKFTQGDTWYGRYDHLKTYPYTDKDPNQVVEIGSFVLESHVNLHGRYDENRGLVDNSYITPENFNKFNSVYSLKNNYFAYKILDDSYYKLMEYPTEITWTSLKYANADVDTWCLVTLASTFDLDGTYGLINAITTWNNNIYCFQDNNIANLLFNSRVQIPTSEGAPIEITNNYKVDGKRDIVNNVGCINKYSIAKSTLFLYFIDSKSNHLMAISSNGVDDITLKYNMHTWYDSIPNKEWLPGTYNTKVFYDYKSKDLYTNIFTKSLGYNETFLLYISFYSYGGTDYMFNAVDDFYCVYDNKLYKMFKGNYNEFFNVQRPYYISFVSNGKSASLNLTLLDKTFSTMEFRCGVFQDTLSGDLLSDFPFTKLRVWNEYLDTDTVELELKIDAVSILKKKFNSWYITIPRDTLYNGRDRMRNPWCKFTLSYDGEDNNPMILHDTVVQYYV